MSGEEDIILSDLKSKSKPQGCRTDEFVLHFSTGDKGFPKNYSHDSKLNWLTISDVHNVIEKLEQCPNYGYVSEDYKRAKLLKLLGQIFTVPILVAFSSAPDVIMFIALICFAISIPIWIIFLFSYNINNCRTKTKLKKKGDDIRYCLEGLNFTSFNHRGITWSCGDYGEAIIAKHQQKEVPISYNFSYAKADSVNFNGENQVRSVGIEDQYAKINPN